MTRREPAIDPKTDARCAACGMPLAYDRFIQDDAKATERAHGDGHCLPCAEGRPPVSDMQPPGPAWALDLIVRRYCAPGGLVGRTLARLGKSRLPLPKSARAIGRLLAGVPERRPEATYDAVVLYSGGKDSSYMLWYLAERHPDLRICAWMLNQGYQSPAAIQNARALTERLGIPLVIDEPGKERMDRLFRLGFDIDAATHERDLVRATMTYGSACWPCFATISARATQFMAEHGAGLAFIGTQRGQNRLDLMGRPAVEAEQLPAVDSLVQRFMRPFQELARARDPQAADVFQTAPSGGVLVPFFEFVAKPPLPQQIAALQKIGWSMPNNTGACSSNCMINELGRQVMRKRFGFDLYQVIDAHETRLKLANGQAASPAPEAPLDADAVRLGAGLIKLDAEETERYVVTSGREGTGR